MILDLGETFGGDKKVDPDVIENIVSDILSKMVEQEEDNAADIVKIYTVMVADAHSIEIEG